MTSDRPTAPAPPIPIAPRPDDGRVVQFLDIVARDVVRFVARHGGSPAAARKALDIAHHLRVLGALLEVRGAETIAADILGREGE